MLVIADSSPIIVLILIGHIDVLPKLFEQVVIPPEVSRELIHFKRQQKVRDFMASHPAWLHEQTPTTIEQIPSLHAGEIAAISLAKELKADLLLIDEVQGRKAAAERHIPYTGTVGVLEFAADKQFLNLEDAFEGLKKTDFWISAEFLDERLKLYLAQKK